MKRLLVGGAVLALGITGTGLAQAESGFKVTGGGQAFASSSPGQGPGDTYGFNAQEVAGEEDDAAKGQFNTIQRTAGAATAKGQGEHIRGEVNCLVPLSGGEDGAARFGGTVRGEELNEDGEPDPLLFSVDVTDNGEGSRADGDDMIVFRTFRQSELEDNENACDMEPESENGETVLARGNVQIHNQPEEESEPATALPLP